MIRGWSAGALLSHWTPYKGEWERTDGNEAQQGFEEAAQWGVG
jgi:hypothetical protein